MMARLFSLDLTRSICKTDDPLILTVRHYRASQPCHCGEIYTLPPEQINNDVWASMIARAISRYQNAHARQPETLRKPIAKKPVPADGQVDALRPAQTLQRSLEIRWPRSIPLGRRCSLLGGNGNVNLGAFLKSHLIALIVGE